ncbi:MAG: hypothetical protein ACREMH_07200 [Gemmatimonadales bacterium]
MRQETAVQDERGRAGRATFDRLADRRRGGDRRLASVEVYLDRGTPNLFAKWWSGLVSMAPALGRDGLK